MLFLTIHFKNQKPLTCISIRLRVNSGVKFKSLRNEADFKKIRTSIFWILDSCNFQFLEGNKKLLIAEEVRHFH